MKKIRLGILGCGRVSVKHFEALQKNTDLIELVAVCDADIARAEKAAAPFSAQAFSDFDLMLDSCQLDAVSILLPNGLHPEYAIRAARKKVNVITEKPMAIKYQDGLAMKAEAEKNGVKLFVIYQNRFNPTIQALNKAVEDGRFGQVHLITSNVFWHRPQEYYTKDATWHGTKNLDGGAFYTQASHYVDLICWVVRDELKSVHSNLVTLARKIETEDCGVASIEWKNGTLGNLNVTVLTYANNLEGSVTIIGEKGTVRIGGIAMNEIEYWEFSEMTDYDRNIKSLNYHTDSVYGYGHIDYYRNMAETLLGKANPLVDADQGLVSLKLLDAIYESAQKGAAVTF
ncbi:MAG: Gfo/Idh/MocA family protein [Rickettsiales bacterium]